MGGHDNPPDGAVVLAPPAGIEPPALDALLVADTTRPASADLDQVAHRHLVGLVALSHRLAEVDDLESVLDAVVDAAMALLEPAACAIDLAGEAGGGPIVSVTRGLNDLQAAWWTETHGALDSVRSGTPVPIVWPGAIRAGAPSIAVQWPLALGDHPGLGTFTLFAAGTGPPPAWPAPVIDSLVTQTSAAVSGSRVRLRDLLAVYSVAQAITGRIDLTQLADGLLRGVATLFNAVSGAIAVADTSAGTTAGTFLARLGDQAPLTATALLDAAAAVSAPGVLRVVYPPQPALLGRRGDGLIAPLLLERKVYGALVLGFEHTRVVRQSERWLLSAIACQVTMALRNAQLYLWSEELAIADERSRIAREIHDGLAQSLAHKVLRLDLCQKLIDRDHVRLAAELEALKASVRADIQDVRHSILALRPLDLEQRGLSEAVHGYISQFAQDTGIPIKTSIDSLEALAPKTQTALFRLAQEALNNIRKHAQAASASVIITFETANTILMRVSDTGRGFDVAATMLRTPGQTGIGLKGMVERTTAAGGTLRIDSTPGHGTTIEVRLPVHTS